MKKKTGNENIDAFALFPDVLDSSSKTKQHKREKAGVEPPSAPDISWLKTGQQDDYEQITDVPMALILMAEGKRRAFVSTVLEEFGYQIEVVDTPVEAIKKLQFSRVNVLIQHTDFEESTLSESLFYNHLKGLSMEKRRYIFYMLTGPEFHTLYDLEALTNSANLVVNDRDIKHLKVILKKSFHDFENLFSSLLDVLDGAGYQ